jgi:predicted nucleotidyltransferase
MKEDIMMRLKAISNRLKKEYNAKQVILFGSYAKGEETEGSDIDLLIIAPTQKRFFERIAQVRSLIRNLRNGLAIAPIVLTYEELEKRVKMGDQFIKEILERGINL